MYPLPAVSCSMIEESLSLDRKLQNLIARFFPFLKFLEQIFMENFEQLLQNLVTVSRTAFLVEI